MKRILKWNVPVDDQPHEIGGGRVVHVGCQDGPEIVQVWTEEYWRPEDPLFDTLDHLVYHKRTVRVVGTGQDFNESGTVVGTVMTSTRLVWHVVRF